LVCGMLPSMVLEVALIDVFPGQEDAFIAAYQIGHPILATTPGCLSVRMTKGIESASRFVLLVEWESVEAHTGNFRNTERFAQWRALIGGHFAKPPLVEHFTDVAPGTRPGPELPPSQRLQY
jgi:heme-degrading monooxygenase HmoA